MIKTIRRRKVKHIIFAIILVCLSVSSALADSQTASKDMKLLATATSWTNQSGSVATFNFSPSSQPLTYTVTGHYINNNSSYKCRGTAYPLTGVYYVNTQTISFSVSWSNSTEDCQSVTGWTGYFNLNQNPFSLTTNWNLAAAGGQITQGRDVFTMNTLKKSQGLIAQK